MALSLRCLPKASTSHLENSRLLVYFVWSLWWKTTRSTVILKAICHHLNYKMETREALSPLFCWYIVSGRFIKSFFSISIFLQHAAVFCTCNADWLFAQGHIVFNVTFLTSAEYSYKVRAAQDQTNDPAGKCFRGWNKNVQQYFQQKTSFVTPEYVCVNTSVC